MSDQAVSPGGSPDGNADGTGNVSGEDRALAILRSSREAPSGNEDGEAHDIEEGVDEDVDSEADDPELDAEADTDAEDAEREDEDDEEFIELTDDFELDVKVNGAMQKVSLADLKENYSGRSELSRQYDTLKKERDEFATQKSEVDKIRSEYADSLNDVKSMLESIQGKPPGRDLLEEDPTEYQRQKLMYDDRVEAVKQVQAEIDKVKESERADQEKAFESWANEQVAKLQEIFPDWNKNNGDNETRKAIFDQALKEGFTAEQIRGVHPYPIYSTLWKAAQYDRIKGKKPEIQKRSKKVPKVRAPGASRQQDSKSTREVNEARKFLQGGQGTKKQREGAAIRLIRHSRQR